MNKIFILTGEPSGDKLASEVIKKIKLTKTDIDYLSVGGQYLSSIGIRSIFDQKKITYMAFTDIFLNIFKIRKKINEAVDKIIEFKPDILFSVDSPDYTLRVAKKVKLKNPKIKTIHFIAPKVWAWREGRVKKMKKYLDHILLLFKFEKKYFDRQNLKNSFVGHPLLDKKEEERVELNELFIDKKIISIFPGSRISEIKLLTPILFNFIKKMNNKNLNYTYVFHATENYKNYLVEFSKKQKLSNVEIISNDNIKRTVIKKSIFAVVKSGTISLEVCKENIPSIIIYKMNFINFILAKFFLKVKYANMINIINDKEIIPELLQNECNADDIFKSVYYFLKKPDMIQKQLHNVKKTINDLTSSTSSSNEISKIILNYLA